MVNYSLCEDIQILKIYWKHLLQWSRFNKIKAESDIWTYQVRLSSQKYIYICNVMWASALLADVHICFIYLFVGFDAALNTTRLYGIEWLDNIAEIAKLL
jgi:hypothetical protein